MSSLTRHLKELDELDTEYQNWQFGDREYDPAYDAKEVEFQIKQDDLYWLALRDMLHDPDVPEQYKGPARDAITRVWMESIENVQVFGETAVDLIAMVVHNYRESLKGENK